MRIVWLLAEAERARYGVFRQAAFGGARLDPALIERLLDLGVGAARRHQPTANGKWHDQSPSSAPTNPYLVLGAAIVLPASGHVILGVPVRGLQFLFFMVILAWVTAKIAPPDASFIGRHAGGFLIYALSILDAYKIARIRTATWVHSARAGGDSAQSGIEPHT